MEKSDYKSLKTNDISDIIDALAFTIVEVKDEDPKRSNRLRKIIKDMENRWESQ